MKNYLKDLGGFLLQAVLMVGSVAPPIMLVLTLWDEPGYKVGAVVVAILFVCLLPAIMNFTFRIMKRYLDWAQIEEPI